MLLAKCYNRFKYKKMTHQKKKIAIIGTVGLPARYGGFETLTEHLVQNMGEEYDLTVYCSAKKYSAHERVKTYKNAQLKYIPLEANGAQSVLYDSISIVHALFYADVLLILGVAGAWLLPFARFFTKKRIIVSIDGIEWKRNKWNGLAKCYLWWAEKLAVKYSHIDISDNESIQDYTALRYGSLSRIIEYGADHTLNVQPTPSDKLLFPFLKIPYAIKVCRIEPENNVHEVLEAFSDLSLHTLVIIGNWKKSDYGLSLLKKYESYPNLFLLDPIYDQRTLDVLRGNAFVYIHGHSAGGTNPSLVEAMYLELPIISYNVSYNKTTTESKALYFNSADELKEIIRSTNIHRLKEIASTMKEIADRRYTWKVVATGYQRIINEVLVSSKKKSVVPNVSQLNANFLLKNYASHLKYGNLFFEKV
jgi:glycosyltransferase involved in cell wall biosynthesis